MDTNLVREQISKLSGVIKKIISEAEEIYREGKRRANEKAHKKKDLSKAQKNFSITPPNEESSQDYH